MKFNTQEELAERLRAGEKWKPVEYVHWCYYSKDEMNSYRTGESAMNRIWNLCDGETEWGQEIEVIEPSGGDWCISGAGDTGKGGSDNYYRNFGTEFKTEQQAKQASIEMRKLNRLRKFIMDTQEELEPDWVADWSDCDQEKYVVVHDSTNSWWVSVPYWQINLLTPVGSEKVIEHVIKCLNNGTMVL